MDKTLKIYVVFLLVFIAGIVYIDLNRQKPVNWTATYDNNDKIPFGMFVLDKEINALLKERKITKLNTTPYEYFEPLYDYDSLVKNYKVSGTFLRISEFSDLDDESVKELFYFAEHGNTVFLSMKEFPKIVLDSLALKLKSDYSFLEKSTVWTANSKLGTKKYSLAEGVGDTYFSKIDTLNTTVLGYQKSDSTRINFIKIAYKTGNFILHTQPAVFTNYYLLKNNQHEYTEKVLGYIPNGDVFWYVKNQNGAQISKSPLRFVFGQPALKSAWFLFLLGMIVFMIFNAKRRQRVVPILNPLPNTTVDFAKTIGNLYFQEGDHGNLMDKKIIYFLEKLRNDYLLDTTVLDGIFIKRLQQKSGKDLIAIQTVVQLIIQHQKNNYSPTENDLIALNNAIEKVVSK